LLALAAVASAILPGFLYAQEIIDLGQSFRALRQWAPQFALAATVGGVATISLSVWKKAWSAAILAVSAVLIGLAVWLSVSSFMNKIPLHSLHDATTNLESPPLFEIIEPRTYGSSGSPAAFPHPRWREKHAKLYPDLKPFVLELPLAEAFARTLSLVKREGWELAGQRSDGEIWRVEATAITSWFRFRDDVVIVLTAEDETQTRVNMRSVSRIGYSDLGKNAKRIREFLKKLGTS